MCSGYGVNIAMYTFKLCCMRKCQFQTVTWEARDNSPHFLRVTLERTKKLPPELPLDNSTILLRRCSQSQCSLDHLSWRLEGSCGLGQTWTPPWILLAYFPITLWNCSLSWISEPFKGGPLPQKGTIAEDNISFEWNISLSFFTEC